MAVLGTAASVVVDLRAVLTVLNLAAFAVAIVGLRYPAVGVLGITMLCTLLIIRGSKRWVHYQGGGFR